jgi:hypothetical protein
MKDIIISQVGKQLGLENSDQTNSAVDGVLATIVKCCGKQCIYSRRSEFIDFLLWIEIMMAAY